MSQYSEPGAKAGGADRDAATRRAAEPLAITSIACRLPGAPDVEAFWTLLTEERHAIGRLPEDRFSSAKFLRQGKPSRGRTYTNAAGVIDDLWDFDAAFFGLSPREAEQMDPQQRMMLEVAWRAIEAALPLGGPLGAARRPGGFGHTGVYIGASTMDHAQRFATDIASIDTPFMTGNTLSIIANRLSQTFGFEGPSLTVDTACASGITALHLAAEALRSGEIETAVVGAVNVLLQPWNFVGFSQATMLSPTGLCRAFDARADGYVRAEGAVALVLRRMEAAAAGGEPVRGVLRATGISADGLKPGLSKPDAAGQAALIERVHRASGLQPERLAFIEAHGTGTPVGDPVEARAIAAALGPGRAAAGLGALPIGSVKSNIGHLEPAAGLAGVLKALLALERGRLPATLHVDDVNPAVAAEERLTVAREAVVLPDRADGAPHVAGVSAFGFGGANGHVVLEGVRATEPSSRADVCEARPLPPLILSANTERGLRSLAAAWRETLSAPASDGQEGPGSASRPNGGVQAGGADLAKLLAASGQRSALRRERAVLVGDSVAGLRSALGALAAEDADSLDSVRSAVVARGSASAVSARLPEGDAASLPPLPLPSTHTIPGAPVGFLFGGNGAQWAGMGETLLAEDPVYAAGFARAAEALVAAGGSDPRVLREDPSLPERLQESGPAQAFLFALQVGMADALAASGVRPAAVLGHSVGEVTAAWAAGALTLADAARIIALRAAAVAPLHGTGTMAALLASAAKAEALIADEGLAGNVSLAAENSPRSVTLSGDVEGIEALSKAARRARLACRKLHVAYPYHAPAMELVRETLLEGLRDLVPGRAGSAAFFSSVTGGLLAGPNEPERAALGAGHWWQNAREPVRFWSAAEAMAASGVGCFVEVSPRPVLAGYLRDLSAPGGGEPVPCLAAMQGPGRPSLPARALAAAALCHGASTDRSFLGPTLSAPPVAHGVSVPPVPLERRRYQAPLGSEAIDLFGLAAEAEVQGVGQSPAAAPTLLGLRDRPGTGPWHARLDAILHPWIADHRVDGHVVLPAAAFAAIALAAGRENGQNGPVEVEDLDVISPLAVAGEGVDLRTVLDEPTGRLSIESRARSHGAFWQPYARATLCHAPARNAGKAIAEALQRHADTPHYHATSPGIAYSDGGEAGSIREIDPEVLYDQLAGNGLHYGPGFRLIERCELLTDSAGRPDTVRAVLPASGGGGDGAERRLSDEAFRGTIPPPFLDACFHALSPLIGNSDPATRWLPVRMARIWMASALPEHAAWHVTARLRRRRAAWISADLAITDDEGRTFLAIEGLSLETRGKVSTERLEDWAEPLIRLRRHAAAPRSEGPDMAGSAEGPALLTPRLQRRGCWQATKPVPDAALLLDELCRSVLAEAVRDARTRSLPRTEAGEALLRRLEERLRLDLQSSPDSVTEDREDGGYASSAELVPALIAVCPEAAPTLQAVIALPEELEARLAATDGTDAWPQLPPVAEQAIAQFWSLAVDALCDVEPSDPEIALAVDGAPEAVIARLAGLSQVRGCRDLSSGTASLPEPPSSADASPQAASDLLICTSPAPDLLRAREQLSEGGEIVIAVLPMFGSVFAEEDAVAQAATALGEAGFETVCTGWFDTGSCVLGLVSGRVPAFADTSGFAALGMTADEAPETSAAVILLHDDGQEAAAAEAAARLGGAVTAPITAAPPLGGSDVFVFPAQGSWKATIRDCVATRLELARFAALAGHAQTAELPLRLTFLARDAGERCAVDGDLEEEVAGAALSGLVRALANEEPKLRVSLVQSDDPVAAILALRTAPPPGDERILAYEGGAWRAPRVVRRSLEPERGARRLEARRPGAIDSLHWAAADLPSPGPGEVLLRVEAAGLNFRDVMWAQRRLPAEALELGHAGATLGMECVGRVVALGPGIAEDTAGGAGSLALRNLEIPIGGAVAIGDRVLALGSGALATHLTVDRWLVVRLPDGLSAPSAAGLAVTGITARYALEDLAQLAGGETLLLHGGAGGVGLAALAFARARGARVIASASTPSRRRLLEALGAAATIDSRSPDFADRVRALTDGRGCDVVLNSLAGEAQRRSLGCLAPFGRFVELGKRDIYENAQLPLREFARNLSFFAFDADQLLVSKPERVVALLEEVVADCASGRLPPLPVRVVPADATEEGFRLMQRAGHIGKIVLIPPDLGEVDVGPAEAPLAAARQAPASQPGEETGGSNPSGATSAPPEGAGDWLIVGGAGGLGRAIAVHLARRGAGRLWIVGRRASSAAAAKEWELARAAGATPLLRDVDASDREAMDALAAEIAAAPRAPGAPMLEGVIHAAMVLDDAPLNATTPERAEPVLRAKIDTALSLHAATVPLAPGRFVVLGSIAARLGNPGQAAYSTANAALEGLVRARRRAGLPGVALALGPVSDAGYLADNREQATKIAKTLEDLAGTRPLRVDEVLSALDAVLDDPAPPVSVSVMPEGAALDPNALPIARSPMMSRLARPPSRVLQEDASNPADAASIAALPIAEALKALEAAVRAALSRILRLPVAEIPSNRPLGDLGLDSLMALDLKNTLEERNGFAVPVTALGAETTISSLAAMLCDGLPEGVGTRPGSDREPPIDRMTILHDPPSEGSAHSSPSEGGASRPQGAITEDTNLAGALSAAHAAGLPSAMQQELARRSSARGRIARAPSKPLATGRAPERSLPGGGEAR